MNYSLFLLGLVTLMGCKAEGSKAAKSKAAATNCSANAPGLLTTIRQSTTSIDLISLKKEVNVSMSFDNPEAVNIILSFITDEKGELSSGCQPEGRLVFQRNGEITHDIDLYYQNNCNAFAFMKDNAIIACNKISSEGIEFFKNFLKHHPTPPPQEGGAK